MTDVSPAPAPCAPGDVRRRPDPRRPLSALPEQLQLILPLAPEPVHGQLVPPAIQPVPPLGDLEEPPHQPGRLPLAAAASRIAGASESLSPGIRGATLTPAGTPARDSS